MAAPLCPAQLEEPQFWRAYFSAAHSLFEAGSSGKSRDGDGGPAFSMSSSLAASLPEQASQATASPDGAAPASGAGMPGLRPAGQRRFAPAPKLQTSGVLSRERAMRFLLAATEMVASDETRQLLLASGAPPQSLSLMLMQWQLELLESQGIEHRLGTAQLQPNSLSALFPEDAELHQAWRGFVSICSNVTMAAAIAGRRRAPADAAKRLFSPSAQLQADGELDGAKRIALVRGMALMLRSSEARDRVAAASGGGAKEKADADAKAASDGGADRETATSGSETTADEDWHQLELGERIERLQREYAEHFGVEQELGMRELGALAAGDAGELDAETRKAFEAMRAARDALKKSVEEAEGEKKESSRPTVSVPGSLRYEPAAELQSEGELRRELILRFCQDMVRELMSEETIAALAEVPQEKAGPLSVLWQRQYLESLGVEQEFGCEQLSMTPVRFPDDMEVMRRFKAFQTACAISMQKAMQMRGPEAAPVGAAAPDPTSLRFATGTRVKCRTGEDSWSPGRVLQHNYREPHFPPGMYAAYQVKLDDGRLIFAPKDDDMIIRRAH